MNTTYITKKGFGGLLEAGQKCKVVRRNVPRQGDVHIQVGNLVLVGKRKDIRKARSGEWYN